MFKEVQPDWPQAAGARAIASTSSLATFRIIQSHLLGPEPSLLDPGPSFLGPALLFLCSEISFVGPEQCSLRPESLVFSQSPSFLFRANMFRSELSCVSAAPCHLLRATLFSPEPFFFSPEISFWCTEPSSFGTDPPPSLHLVE